MRPIDFTEATITFTAPVGQEDRVDPLRGWRSEDGDEVVELWRPSLLERLSILVFGRVWVRILTTVSPPPIAVVGRRTIFEPSDEEPEP